MDLGPLSKELAALPRQFLPPATVEEMTVAQHEFENITIVTECGKAVEQGFVTGVPGNLRLDSVQTTPLMSVIKLCRQLQCRTEQAAWMFEVAEAVLELRLCVKDMDYKNMMRVIQAVRATDKSHVNVRCTCWWWLPSRHACACDGALIRCSQPLSQTLLVPIRGPGKLRRPSGVDMIPGFGTSAARAARGRASLTAATAAPASPGVPTEFYLSDTTLRELQLVQDHYDNYVMVQELSQALQSNGISGPVGNMDLDAVDTEELTLAIRKAERARPKTTEAQALLDSAKVVRDARVALRNADWETVHSVIDGVHTVDTQAALASGVGDTSFGRSLHPVARAEIVLLKEEYDCYVVSTALTSALTSGGVAGQPGALDLSGVCFDTLSSSIETATTLGCPTVEMRRLLTVARFMLQIRRAVVSGDWDTVESVVTSSEDVFGPALLASSAEAVVESVRSELALIRAEIDDKKLCAKLRSGLAVGLPVGEIGRLRVGQLNWVQLDAALQFAMHIGVHTSKARQLVASVSLIRGLRQSLRAGHWDALEALVEHAKRVSLLCRLCLDALALSPHAFAPCPSCAPRPPCATSRCSHRL
jgi:hypothetical protein